MIQLAEMMHTLPSKIDEEPLEWVARMYEYLYHKNREIGTGDRR